ncbi:MAG: transcription antitermination factor NusB [bacterium]
MVSRRRAREIALQLLFQMDVGGNDSPEDIETFWQDWHRLERNDFTENLVAGTRCNLNQIDALIREFAHHWTLERMSSIDRNVLRLATYELIFERETPASVIINEAINIAKRFGTENSGRFVNGILDKIKEKVRPEIPSSPD